VTGYLWGYIDPETIPHRQPDFDPMQGSKDMFMFQTADPADARLAKTPTIQYRPRLCMCPPLPPSALREWVKSLPLQVRGLRRATAWLELQRHGRPRQTTLDGPQESPG
jgi:hypothetical protein